MAKGTFLSCHIDYVSNITMSSYIILYKIWLTVLINSLKTSKKVSRHKQRLVALLGPYVWVQKYPDGWHVSRAHTATEIDLSLTDLYPDWRPLVVCLYFLNPKPLSPWENEPVILSKQHKLRQILCIGKYRVMKHREWGQLLQQQP